MYLLVMPHTLGISSIYGLNFVARQDFWGGNYPLIQSSSNDYMPNSDYYSSYFNIGEKNS